jgi:O-antigen ligase
MGSLLYLLRPLFFPRVDAPVCPPAFLGLTAFLLYGGALILRADAPHDASIEMLKLAGHVLAFQAWAGLAGEHGRWRWLLALLMLSATLMAWYAIIQHAHGSRMVLNVERPQEYEMRASGAFICPNHFANILAMTASMAAGVLAMSAAGVPLRLLALYAILVVLPPLYWSGSRSAWLGLVAGMTVVAGLLGMRRGLKRGLLFFIATPLALGAAGAVVWMLSPMVQERVADALKGNVRLALWRDTLLMIADQPWLGSGPGQYRWVYPQYWRNLDIYINPEYAHNDYLQLVAEFGIFGAALLLGALGWALIRLLRQIRSGDAERGDFLIAGFAGACAAASVHALFDYNFQLYGNVQFLAAFGGITIAVLRSGGHLSDPSWCSRIPLRGAVLAAAPLALAALVARASAAHILTLRGDAFREAAQLERALVAYRAALRIEPANGAAHRGIGLVRAGQAVWNFDREAKAEQIAEATARFERALSLNPRDLAARFGMVRVLQTQGRQDEALAALRELVERAPFHRDYWVELGLQLRAMRDYPAALEAFERARHLRGSEQIDLNIQFLQRRIAASAAAPAAAP